MYIRYNLEHFYAYSLERLDNLKISRSGILGAQLLYSRNPLLFPLYQVPLPHLTSLYLLLVCAWTAATS
jgi:hypothetical protein